MTALTAAPPFLPGLTRDDPEQWHRIPDWPHEASTHGRIRRIPWIDAAGRLHLGGILAQYLDKRPGKGYLYVTLVDGQRRRKVAVHVLVLEAWRGLKLTPAFEGCHGNDIRTDNYLDNLRWDTKAANRADRERNSHRSKAVTVPVTAKGGNGHDRYESEVRAGTGSSRRTVTPPRYRDGGLGTGRCPIPSTFSFFPPSVKSAFRVLRPRKETH